MMAMVVAIEIAWGQNLDTPKEEPRDQKTQKRRATEPPESSRPLRGSRLRSRHGQSIHYNR